MQNLAGNDFFLTPGEETILHTKKDFALVSAEGPRPLVLEILGDERRSSPSMVGDVNHPMEREVV